MMDRDRITATALRMLSRYSTPKKAAEMAHLHGCDYVADRRRGADEALLYWNRVYFRIIDLTRVRVLTQGGNHAS